MSAILEMSGVTAGYLADIEVLRDLGLAAEAGSITGLIGLNGAGKSTVMKTICGFLKPKSGTIRYDGEEITGLPPHRLLERGIFYIPQESSLFRHMSVADNLRLPLETLARRGKSGGGFSVADRFAELEEHFPALHEKMSSPAGNLSGGQQKLVEFAKAFAMKPRLCLIDEPSIGLAPKMVEEVFGHIRLFASLGIAILLVDHNVRRVVGMSSRIYVLSLGTITASGTPADFAGDLHEQVKGWLGINF
ncbi:MAG: ABC transporter ATP-binding protein [Beijerinckiaceae bacterium]